MTFDYDFGGLTLRSSTPLPVLRPAEGSAIRQVLVTAEVGQPPVAEAPRFAWPGRYGLRLGELAGRWLLQSAFDGSFLIERDGRAMHMICEHLPPTQATLDVLTRRVLPRLPILFGATTVHGAAVATDGRGLLLLGESGAGKSTLSAALAQYAGWDVLSDDMSVLWSDTSMTLAPAAPGVCLWQPSREALGLSCATGQQMPGYDGKLRHDPTGWRPAIPAALRGFVFLDRQADLSKPRLEPLALAQGLSLMIPQIMHFDPSAGGSPERVVALQRVNAAMKVAGAWRLTYPATFASLHETSTMLASHPALFGA